ncbi:MAG: alkaline phosphatase [Candidatus Calescibacterium sp.]|nr:alkaline phosphatase [Candidatus Calescibacterium sp.]MDW8132303.1 alkaline phosphatase [Candidatus Calescibacterium sp.]
MKNISITKNLPFFIVLMFSIFSFVIVVAKSIFNSSDNSKSIILVIGDGMGLPIITAYDYYKSEYKNHGYSNFSKFDGSFLVRTRSEDYVITDSAAGATAFATGIRVQNYQVGVMKNGSRIPTIMDIAKNHGKSTGIVVECTLTHATPAAFYSFSKSRSDDDAIARQLIYSNIDIAIGGGFGIFQPYIRELERKGYKVIYGEEKLDKMVRSNEDFEKLIAFTAKKHPPKYKERKIDLASKTKYVLSRLSKNRKGFFLMVEASQIDWYGHENKLMEQLDEMEDLDKLLDVVISYQNLNPNTLVLVVSDHDCGGLTLIDKKANRFSPEFKVNYSSDYHTAEHIVGFYKGFIKPKPIIDNTEVYNLMYEYIR